LAVNLHWLQEFHVDGFRYDCNRTQGNKILNRRWCPVSEKLRHCQCVRGIGVDPCQ